MSTQEEDDVDSAHDVAYDGVWEEHIHTIQAYVKFFLLYDFDELQENTSSSRFENTWKYRIILTLYQK